MSITVHHLRYNLPQRAVLFENISFSVTSGQKAALIGNNGTGKSTLLRLIAGQLTPTVGEVVVTSDVWLFPQHMGQYDHLPVAGALAVAEKIKALHAILDGDASIDYFDILNDDWTIEERVTDAMTRWGLEHLELTTPVSQLSGGEKTRLFLSALDIHTPEIILMDEPTNHLDSESRKQLYCWIERSKSTLLVISHDRELLNLLPLTFELTRTGITRYGGNYDFYKEEHDLQLDALSERIKEKEKALRSAKRKARETTERKERMDARGEKKQLKAGVPRILMGKMKEGAELSGAKLKDKHTEIIVKNSREIKEIRELMPEGRGLQIDFDNSRLHKGKILLSAEKVNFGYSDGEYLWKEPLDFVITSGERIAIEGGNGSGKTSLIKLLMGNLPPCEGVINRADFSYVYLDQDYSIIDNNLSVRQQLDKHNIRLLPEADLGVILHRFLFPYETWDKKCSSLSGGERMRMSLSCLQVSREAPDIFILDEPTNNLDIRNLEILTQVVSSYSGTVIVISHDSCFKEQIRVERSLFLK